MLTVNFGVPDLARTRFVVSPMGHVLTALTGSHPWAGARRARWWIRMRGRVPHTVAPLLDVVSACRTGIPDFLVAHVPGTRRQLADELDALLATTPAELRQALTGYGTGRAVPRVVIELRDGDTRQLRRLADSARALFQTCLAEDWSDIQRHLRTDIAQRAHIAGEAGIGAMLGGLHHRASWREDGVLRCAVGGPDRVIDLNGRGLELYPNFFVQDGVGAVLVPRRPAVLLHPTTGPSADREELTTDPLSGLIGSARARALRAVGQEPCSTTELAARLGIGLSTASAHAAALRMTGAITTQRQGRQVRHLVAPLGHALLSTVS
ncbi:DNA-binding transcriptional ArsR family regulator [Kitasatospora gansuensis]|uniref:DNA-binding transcriptional ArsR family regulator n=1 Tax=Kitasatospora gansuensis TaxID=258050 RepID=A0A7W7SHQ9_9ACTN|nr:winged helix-turn-helix transcriptional regulator [Kitasatospora gansuensis]MBB4950695.1 DNA-binding transcriptional ArsR family regulator [Kitasatospora gansuensis]